jgi:iron complex outermembrane recepter protein
MVPRLDLAGSVTYADAETRRNRVLPVSEGKLIPGVPHWKATLVGTWRPTDQISLTAAMRMASRIYGTLDNSDVVGNTWQGFHKYLVVDLRARVKVNEQMAFAFGVDNVTNDRYFLFHPFPQRGFTAEVEVRF